MGFGYTCDGPCGSDYADEFPAGRVEMSEQFFATSAVADEFKAAGIEKGDLLTFCGECLADFAVRS